MLNFVEEINYKLHHADADLDYEDYFFIEDVQVNSEFTGDNDDYAMLSEDVPSAEEWKKDKRDMSVGFNVAQKDACQGLHNEVNHITRKIKSACQKESLVFDDLVELKYGPNSDIVNTFVCSNIASFKNDYDDVCKFLGTFFFCSWLGFTPRQALNKNHGNAIFHPDLM